MDQGYVLMSQDMKDNIEQMQRELWEERCQKAAIALLEGKAISGFVSCIETEVGSVTEWLQELKRYVEEENDSPDVMYKLYATVVDDSVKVKAKYICL